MTFEEQLDDLDRIEKERLKESKYFTDDGVEIVIRHVENSEIVSRVMTWNEYLIHHLD